MYFLLYLSLSYRCLNRLTPPPFILGVSGVDEVECLQVQDIRLE